MSELPDIVIGSGPSGVSVAKARLSKGRHVLMLDAGKTLEPENDALRAKLAALDPAAWSKEHLSQYKAGQINAPDGAIRKFGSDFAVEPHAATLTEASNWLGLRASNATGGLSNVWGASVLPSAEQDITDWPISTGDLAPHYKAVAGFMPISGRQDAIEALYPAQNMADHTPLPPTPQARELLRRADAKDGLCNDVTIGAARNAASQCVTCGLCLHGCPYGYIWSASHTLQTLKSHADFTYKETKATHIAERPNDVQITLATGETITGARLFVAAGVLETAKLYLTSFSALTTLTLLDSQHFFTPFLHHWSAPSDPKSTPHHTLTGAFAEFQTPGRDRLVHAQLYTWNDQYKREMMAKYGTRLPLLPPLFELLSKRLIVAQSFLHSDYSGKIGLTLKPGDPRLEAEHRPNPDTAKITKAARTHLSKALRKIGLHALTPAGHSGAPGSSFHVGGSLPMAAHPEHTQTDPLGRLKDMSRIHAVDASVMTSVPASTITFTVMANAHRIGTLAP